MLLRIVRLKILISLFLVTAAFSSTAYGMNCPAFLRYFYQAWTEFRRVKSPEEKLLKAVYGKDRLKNIYYKQSHQTEVEGSSFEFDIPSAELPKNGYFVNGRVYGFDYRLDRKDKMLISGADFSVEETSFVSENG